MHGNLKASLLVIGLCLAVTFMLYIAANKALLDIEENGCEMTYMYEYPKYIKVNLEKKLSKSYPRYGLYIYGEGGYADELLRKSKPTGIPVLFIPGNAGSYKQVRSLASVALRIAETHTNHFNYFTVDFDEDLCGLYGGVLMDQAKFVHSCLRHILRMYKGNKHAPESVVIIGHSMGGLIARALFILDGFQPRMVHFIVTLGTPHVGPVIPLDVQLISFYSQVNKFWHNSSVVNNVTILSFTGGSRDILVPSKLSGLHFISSGVLHYSSVTTSIPHVWLTIDHLALCWCKQLVLVINRALFDMIGKKNFQIRRGTFQNHALKRHFGYCKEKIDCSEETYGKTQKLPSGYNLTFLDVGKQYVLAISGTILIPIASDENNVHFMALTNSDIDIQIKTCTKVQNETCVGSMDFLLRSLPIAHGKVLFVDLSANTLAKFSHIMVSPLKYKSFSSIVLQFTSKSNIDKVFSDFGIFGSSQTFLSTNTIFTNVSLPMVKNVFDVFLIKVKKINCENGNIGLLIGRVHVPWFDEDIYANNAANIQAFDILLKQHTSKPITSLESPQLHIWNVDKCSLEVTIQQQFGHTLGQLFKMYAVDIPQWVYFWMMTILTLQISEMSNKGIWSSTWSTITSNKLLKMIPLIVVIACVYGQPWMNIQPYHHYVNSLWPYDWLLPKLFIISSALAAMVFINFILELTISSLARLCLCCSSKLRKPLIENHSLLVFTYIFFVLCIIGLSLFCCSIAVYLLTFVMYICCCKKTKEHKQCLEKITNSTQCTSFPNHLNFCKIILNLLVMLSFQMSPSFIVWLKVLPFSWSLPSSPFPLLVVLLGPTVICSMQMDLRMPPKYASWIVLSIWYIFFLLSSLAQLPYIVGIILLITDFFVLCKHKKHIKSC